MECMKNSVAMATCDNQSFLIESRQIPLSLSLFFRTHSHTQSLPSFALCLRFTALPLCHLGFRQPPHPFNLLHLSTLHSFFHLLSNLTINSIFVSVAAAASVFCKKLYRMKNSNGKTKNMYVFHKKETIFKRKSQGKQ